MNFFDFIVHFYDRAKNGGPCRTILGICPTEISVVYLQNPELVKCIEEQGHDIQFQLVTIHLSGPVMSLAVSSFSWDILIYAGRNKTHPKTSTRAKN